MVNLEEAGALVLEADNKMKINNKSIITGIFLILTCAFIFAGNIDVIDFKDKSTGAELTDVQYLLYTCPNIDCTSVNELVQNLNSGSDNYVSYEYDSTERLFYGAYMFKECYLPYEDGFENWGDGGTYPWTYEFERATSCHSPIDSFSITNNNYANEPIIINMQATLEADAHSAFTNLELEYTPAGYENYYSVETSITLEIFDDSENIVHTKTKTYEIMMDTSQNVEFTWTPTTSGDYSARITTNVVDCQCESSFTQFSEKQFLVWSARPQNQCYTIINDLEATPEFATQGDLVTIRFNKISNYADNSYVKTPVPTAVTYEITNNGNDVYSDTAILPANSNPEDYQEITFQWTPSFAGDFNIKVTGVCDSALCDGKTNPEDIAILGFFVKSISTYDVTFIAEDTLGNLLEGVNVNFGTTQTGETNSAGEVIFESNTGTYNWVAELSGYESENGNVNVVNSDVIVNVQLSEIIPSVTTLILDYPVGGEILKGEENILWTASNSENHPLLIDLDYSLDNGFVWTMIAQNEINDGNYSWNTLNYPDNKNYLLRIKATDTLTNLFVYDQTTTTFEIDNNDSEEESKKDSKKGSKYSPTEECISIWECSGWSKCNDNVQTRNCIDLNNCEIHYNKPSELRGCEDLSGHSIINLGNLNEESKNLSAGTFLLGAIIFGIICILICIFFLLFRK